MTAPDAVAPGEGREFGSTYLATLEALAGEVAALRSRLDAAEYALGLRVPPGRPAPPPLPDLRRRLAAIERRAGIVLGLAPLPGFGAAISATAAVASRTHRWAWRDRG